MSFLRRPRTYPVLVVALALAACGTTAGVAVATTPSAGPAAARAAEKYWTAERMAAAQPVERGSRTTFTARSRGIAAAVAPSGTPQGSYGAGIPMVGTFFSSSGPTGPSYCTASVVRSAGRDLLMTAGHCAKSLAGGKQIFVPQYLKGQDAAHQPYGVFPVERAFTDPRYTKNSKGADSDLDFGFVRVGPNAKGTEVQDAAGALRLTPTPRWNSTVTVTGYPGTYNPDLKAISCTVPTMRLAGYHQTQMKCGGFYGGTSGSPWIAHYDAAARTGDAIGLLGGWNGGGNTAGDDWVSYSPVFGREIQDLYQDALADRTPVRPAAAYQSPSDGARLPGAASTWSHARHLAPGDFTGDGHDDLLAIWSDGEVTLYPGDGRGGFGAEKQLAKADSFWKRAAAVTAGDFGGTGRADLMVRWDNGKLSYFEDLGPAGSGKEFTLGAAGSFWRYATQITAGRFGSTDKARDLAVRWADGSFSVYSGASASGPGTGRSLAAAGSYWRNATALAAAQPAGQDRTKLLVRWSDGSLGSYATTGTTLGNGTRLQGPNPSWTASTLTAGDFTSTGRRDDVVVRWSNGETSLYDGTTADALGTWSPVVNAG
ncbi:serine protease [Streptomyces sp. ISL-11]|uniref:trypsin-like serine peptidase n=1 Tax=Streptomyces sp. ISL-11 TaxID=2819174 RepID=UPI001BED1139|nr:FG-GAP-like repeat-containing protein [Streptomyces sp. ISL-11]MBT2387511.1 VCBS repeat-containing protein [Streptomyces sp. ISL-11]